MHAQGSDDVISVKENQDQLYRHLVQQATTASPRSQVRQTEKGHGRQIQRTSPPLI